MILTAHFSTASTLRNNVFYKKRDGCLQTKYGRGDNIKINS